jgi:hypothetical protein
MIWIALQLSFKEVDEYGVMYEASNGPWAVNGIRLGTTLDQCIRKLGRPARSNTNAYNGKVTKDWNTSTIEVTITFENDNGGGKSIEIAGKTLTDHAGKVVIEGSMGENDVKAILKSASVKKSYSPGGSGVISCSCAHTGTTFTCKDDDGYYSVSFYRGSFVGVRGSRDNTR